MRNLMSKLMLVSYGISIIMTISMFSIFVEGKSIQISSKTNGNWTSASTWDLGRVPLDGDTIVVSHVLTIPNRGNVDLEAVVVFVSVSLELVNQSSFTLDALSTITLLPGATISRTTGNGVITINGTDLTSSGNGVMKTGAAYADKDGWGAAPTNPLPVTLINFIAEFTEVSAILKWVTSSEINNDFFVVQRSQNNDWESLGEISGNGTSNRVNYYQYEDVTVDMNNYAYYRLKQVDYDGQVEYSDVVSVEPITIKGHDYSIVRFEDRIEVVFNDDHLEKTQILVLNPNGKIIQNDKFETIYKGQAHSVDLSNLTSNWYFIGIVGQDNVHFEKMILVD